MYLGRFGEDMMKLMSIHSNSIQLESTSIDGVPEIGLLDIILGQVLTYFIILLLSSLLKNHFFKLT